MPLPRVGYGLRPALSPLAGRYGGMEETTSPELENLRRLTARMQAAGTRPRRARPVANAEWLAANGFDPEAGLGGVGGQYVPDYENRLGPAGVPFSPARSAGQLSNVLMDPRQQRFAPGLPLAAPARPDRGPAALAAMEQAGVGRVDPATGAFLGPGATSLMGNAYDQRMAGMIGRLPGGPAIDPEAMAGRRAFAAQRRADALAPRRAAVIERGRQDAEARRLRLGDLTFDERLQAGLPGFAVAREQGGVARDIAAGQLGLGEKQIAAQERMAEAGMKLQEAIAQGNWREAAQARRDIARSQRELTQMQGEFGLQQATIGAEPGLARIEQEGRFRQEEMGIRKEELAAMRADRYQAEADAAYARGDYRMGDRAQSKANKAAGEAPQPGLPGVSGRSLPHDVRAQLSTMEPFALVAELQRRGLSETEINKELAIIFGRDRLLGLSTGRYGRTAANPYGGLSSLREVDPATGQTSPTALGYIFNADSPLYRSEMQEMDAYGLPLGRKRQ